MPPFSIGSARLGRTPGVGFTPETVCVCVCGFVVRCFPSSRAFRRWWLNAAVCSKSSPSALRAIQGLLVRLLLLVLICCSPCSVHRAHSASANSCDENNAPLGVGASFVSKPRAGKYFITASGGGGGSQFLSSTASHLLKSCF